MPYELTAVIDGAPFFAADSVARVIGRQAHGVTPEDDALLLRVDASRTRQAYDAWTTAEALAWAFETGAWSLCTSLKNAA